MQYKLNLEITEWKDGMIRKIYINQVTQYYMIFNTRLIKFSLPKSDVKCSWKWGEEKYSYEKWAKTIIKR